MFNFFKDRKNSGKVSTTNSSIVARYKTYFEELHEASISYLQLLVDNRIAYGTQDEIVLINNCVKFMKEAFQICENNPNAINQLLKVKIICPLAIKERGLYGRMQEFEDGFIIELNPNLTGNGILTAYERTRLYFFHEVGHVIHQSWMKNHIKYQNLSEDYLLVDDFYLGLSMLDEACTQEWAEEIAYKKAGKQRPSDRSISFGNVRFLTNFDFYGELQVLSGLFAKTLRGIGKFDNAQYALSLLSKRALSEDFDNDIIYEYRRDGHYDDLLELLNLMGIIKEASYALFGLGNMDSNIQDVIKRTVTLCNTLRDWREPI